MIPAPTGAADGGEGPAKPAGPLLQHYPAGARAGARPVEKRASKVQKEIEDAVRKVDTPDGVLLAKVRSYGRVEALVVGAYGEFSRDLRKITHAIAESQMGAPRQVRPSAYAVALRYVTRRIARAALVASAEEIVTGLFYSGPAIQLLDAENNPVYSAGQHAGSQGGLIGSVGAR